MSKVLSLASLVGGLKPLEITTDEVLPVPANSRQAGSSGTSRGSKPDAVQPDFNFIRSQCAFINHCVTEAAMVTETEWTLFLSISSMCHDGIKISHDFFKAREDYDFAEAERTIQRIIKQGKQHSCAGIVAITDNTFCSKCTHLESNISPIALEQTSRLSMIGIDAQVESLNKVYAVVVVGSKVLILAEGKDPLTGRSDFILLSRNDFFTLLENRKVWVTDHFGKPRETSLAKVWLEHPNRRQYKGIVFDPSNKAGSEYYNMYKGFAVKPKKGNWKRFKRHIRNVICGGDEALYRYLLGWMAYIVQNPGGPKLGIAIVLRGLEGTGKSFFVKRYLKLFGLHGLHISSQNQLTGRFNQHLKCCLVCYCDEAIWAGNKDAEGVLKALISEETFQVEPKGKDLYTVQNLMNLIISSNNDWVIPAGMTARRFLMLEVSSEFMQNIEYFQSLASEMDNGGDEAMMYDLLHMDLSGMDLRSVPRTRALFDQMTQSFDSVQSYWYERLNEGTLPSREIELFGYSEVVHYACNDWLSQIATDVLHQHYIQFCQQHNLRRPAKKSFFVKKIKELCPGLANCRPTTGGVRTYALKVPDLQSCRASFGKAINMNLDWPDSTDSPDSHPEPNLPSIDDDDPGMAF